MLAIKNHFPFKIIRFTFSKKQTKWVFRSLSMIRYGAKVYAYPGMSHVKAAIYDVWACLGSANFDKFSLRVNLGMNLATSEYIL